jgi:hypothetical protein
LGAELYRTIRTEWLCARALAENVDLLVWISKRRIATPASAAVLLTECPCGGSSQRDCGHCKQGNHCEPKLRRSKHRFPHTAARPQTPDVHSFAWALFCGGKAFSSEPINFVEERGAPATVGLMLLVRQGDLSGPDALTARSQRHQGLFVPLVFATGGTRAYWGWSRLRELIPLDLDG